MKKETKQMLKNIEKWRKKKGLTQKQIADAIGIEEPSVSRLISGVNNINLKRLQEIADLFNISVINLLSDPEIIERNAEIDDLLKNMDQEEYKAWIHVGNVMKNKK